MPETNNRRISRSGYVPTQSENSSNQINTVYKARQSVARSIRLPRTVSSTATVRYSSGNLVVRRSD